MTILLRLLERYQAATDSDSVSSFLLPVEVAFPAAALVALAAGHTAGQAEGASRVCDALGVKLPLVTQYVHHYPVIVVAALLSLAVLIVSGSYLRVPPSWSPRDRTRAQVCCLAVTIASLGLAAAAGAAYPLVFMEMTRSLQA